MVFTSHLINMTSAKPGFCNVCSVRIPKNRPKLYCSICDQVKHFKCQKLSKAEAQKIIISDKFWICMDCIKDTLPIDATDSAPIPKFQVQCHCCNGWSYSPNNTQTCTWCSNIVHLNTCYKNNLGCISCCENLIPGYHLTSYEFLNEDYSRLNKAIFNPYGSADFSNLIGNAFDNDQELNNDYWNEVSDILTHCDYKQQTHVKSPTFSELKIFSLNVRSLVKNISNFRDEITTYGKYDVLCFTETNCTFDKLPNGMPDLLLDGFHEPIIQDPVRKSGKGGGLAVYINKRVCEVDKIEKFCENPDPENLSGEFQFIKIHNCKGFNKTKVIGNVYRSPALKNTDKFIDLLDTVLRKLDRHSRKHMVLVGDVNINLLNHMKNQSAQNLIETISKYGFSQIVSRPTRVTDHSATLIDHVYTNDIHNTLSCNILTVDVSDHLATLTTISLGNSTHFIDRRSNKRNETQSVEFRTFNEANNLKFWQLIGDEKWDDTFITDDAETQYNTFCDTYTRHYNAAYPVESKRARRKNERLKPKCWILPWLEDAFSRKNDLYHKSVNEPTEENIDAYKKMNKFCEKHKNKAKSKYYKKQFEKYKDCSKRQWTIINDLLNRKTKNLSPIKVKDKNGNLLNSNNDVANEFNNYFSGIASNIKNQISSRTTFDPGGFQGFLQAPCTNSMYVKPVEPGEVCKVICTFKNKSTLDTKIEPLKIANSCPTFNETLARVVSTSFRQGVFPTSLKMARVVPIHKEGSKTDVTNYRPISLLSSFSKVYEKLMHNRALEFLDSNGSLFEAQYGFRPGRSCEHALLNAQNTILQSLCKNQVALLLLIDFSKAFDLVDKTILLRKLDHYGIRGIALKWFESYLSNRQQYVSIDKADSSVKELEYGVPQGSILGPLLFIIYINDLPSISNIAKFILYADDANIIVTGSNIHEVLTKITGLSLDLVKWVDCNGLALNLKKTKFMIFTRQRNIDFSSIDLHICNTKIELTTEARFLGVIVDDKLSWSHHISALRMKMSKYLGIMYKIKKYLPLQARIQIFHSFVQSHLNYCSLVWGFAAKSHIESLFRKQKQGIRAIMPGNINYFYMDGKIPEHTKQKFEEYNILTVHGIIVKNALIFLHKLKHFPNMLPKSIVDMMPDNMPTTGSDYENSADWMSIYNNAHYRASVFNKGPLLAISPINACITTLPTLFSINMYKSSAKRVLLQQQSTGTDDEWPDFLLYNIPGLRKSHRIREQISN